MTVKVLIKCCFRRVDYKWAVSLTRYSLELVGLWPSKDLNGRSRFYRKLRIFVAAIFAIFVCTIPAFGALIHESDNLQAVISNLGFAMPMVITIIKFVIMYKKVKVLVPILNMVAEDWAKPKTPEERNVMIRRAKIGRMVNLYGYSMMLSLLLMMGVLPRFGITYRYVTNETDVKKLLIFPAYIAVDLTQSPYFEMSLFAQCLAVPCIGTCYTGVDSLFGLLILHVSGQLQNLRTRLMNLQKLGNLDRALSNTIRDHVRLIRAVDVVESTYTLMLLPVLLYFGAFLCTLGLMLVTMLADKQSFSLFRLWYPAGQVTMAIFQTSIYCIAGQMLVNESEGVHDAAYECDWVDLQPNKAKAVILIMARAERPLQVTAGKILPMTMLTFCNILKASASYISVLVTTF